ncbi:hypothetical protein [Amycolatopsis kentuckyensis]|uniref:hypothetical protein n=1 Tax=Amycolatopsis kentuckyensis TaxID=218823 RepID=UPI001ABF274C|nr:hypothetical protein [Amycolatopsis kentuckyensis]
MSRSVVAFVEKWALRLPRTITAPCTAPPPADLIAQTWATTLVAIVFEPAQRQVAELEVIGLVLP